MDIDRFLEKKPELKRILNEYGNKTLFEYIEYAYTQAKAVDTSYFDDRFAELSQSYMQVVTPILGEEVALGSLLTLKKNRVISTADHQGVISHPFFLSSTYVRTLYAQKVGEKSVITFPCAGISLSNSSFPRGLVVHDSEGNDKKIYFKSLLHKLRPVYTEEKIDKNTVQKMYDTLSSFSLEDEHRHKILSAFKEIFFSDAFLSLADFDEQCVYGSFALWRHIALFQDINLVYVSQEKIVTQILLDHHICKGDTLLHKLLFTQEGNILFQKYFEGIQGAMSRESGTFLFWGIENGERVALTLEDGYLRNNNTPVSFLCAPEVIAQALRDKKIYPSMALCFITLSFYYGLMCGGGFSQVNYLKEMKHAWMGILHEWGEFLEEEKVSGLVTDIFFGEYISLCLSQNKTEPAYGMDLITAFSSVENDSEHISLREAFLRMSRYFSGTLESAMK